MADIDTVRTLFKTEWLGAGVVQNMIRQYGLVEKAVKSLGPAMRGGAKSSGVLGTGMSSLTVALGATAVAIGGVVLAGKALYPFLEQGATVAQLDQSFQHLNDTMTNSPDLLNEMKEASRGTLTTMAAQEGFMTLVAGSSREMTQALADAAPRILEISKAANKLNPVLGDTNFMFTSLAKGLKRAEPRLIDNLGLKLRISDANRTMADELGKSVMQLTAEEKQMAILNETLRAGTLLIDQVGGSVDGLGDSFLRLDSSTTDYKNSLKEILFITFQVGKATDLWAAELANLTEMRNNLARIEKLERDGFISEEQARAGQAKAFGIQTGKTLEATIALQDELIAGGEKRAKLAQETAEEEARIYAEQIKQYILEQKMKGNLFSPEVPQETFTRRPSDMSMSIEEKKWRWEKEYDALQAAMRRNAEQLDEIAKDNLSRLDKDSAAVQEWADSINEATKEAMDAWHAYNAEIGDLAEAHIDADRDASFFKTAIDDIGDSFYNAGGATKEQSELLGDLQDSYDKAAKTLEDLRSGVKGFGFDEEKMGKAVEKATGQMAHFEARIAAVKVAEDDWRPTHQDAVWDWENLADAMTDAAKAADLGVRDFVRYKMGIEELTEEQAAAVIAATAMETEMGRIFERVKVGEIDPESAKQELEKFAKWLSEQDLSVFLTPHLPQISNRDQLLDDLKNLLPQEDIAAAGTEVFFKPSIAQESEDLWAKLMGVETIPPLDIEAGLNVDPLTMTLEAWRSENSVIVFTAEFDYSAGETFAIPGFTPIGANAGGGNILANTPTLVGEQGPEIVTPGSNSTVTPNNQAGGVNLTMNLTVNGNGNGDELKSVVEDVLLEALQQVGVI